jgi:hypothetical protein
MSVSASIVCSFGGVTVGSSTLIAEWDDIENDSKTTFLTTETAFFIIYKYPSTVVVHKPVPTAGMVVAHNPVTRTKTEILEFVGTKEVSLAYPPSGSVTVNRWYGNVGSDFTISGFSATISSEQPCLCEVTYQVTGELWELYPPNNIDLSETPEYPVIVYITASET